MRQTTLEVAAAPVRVEGDQEVLELTVKNTGPMTAFPVEPHPLISYRTDLIVDNNHCFIPPRESRTITIRASREPACGLSLAQTGWWISAWNAEKLTVKPSTDVLLAVGRRDRMCREFLGYFEPEKAAGAKAVLKNADAGQVAYPATAEFFLPAGTLDDGQNIVEVQLKNPGWFTWDSLECIAEN